MRKMLIVFIVVSNLLVIAAVVLSFTTIEFQFINTSSFVDKIFSWLVFLLVMFLTLVVICICVYCMIHFWEPGNAFFVVILTFLGGFLVLALPAEVIDKYFGGISRTPFPVLFYVFFAVFFALDFFIVAVLLAGDKKRLPVPAMVKKIVPAIAATAKVFVTIGNVVYFLAFLIVPLVGIANFYVSDKEL